MRAAMPESHRLIAEARPAWATLAFAVAVFGGAIGGIFLFLRKKSAYDLFVVSFLGVAVTMVHALGLAGSKMKFSAFEFGSGVIMPPVLAAFSIWYSKWAERRQWIG